MVISKQKVINILLIVIFLLDLGLYQVNNSVLPVFSKILILGRPISIYLHYFVWLVSLLILVSKALKSKLTVWEFLLLVGIVNTYIISLINMRPMSSILTESSQFMVPLLIYEYIKKYNIDFKKILYTLFITCLVCGMVSLLVATRVIQTDIWAATGDYVRSAGIVDGTCGVTGLLASVIVLGNRRERYSIILTSCGLIGSLLIIIFGLSRLRIVICLICIAIFSFMRQKDQKGNNTTKKKYLFLFIFIIVLLILAVTNSGIVTTLERMIRARFNTLGEDNSSAFRSVEMNIHFKLLFESFGIGQGWGFRDMYILGKKHIFTHIVYSGILMHMGLFFGGAYIIYLFKIAVDAFKNYGLIPSVENQIVFIELIALLLVGFGGGGITQGGALFMMALMYSNKLRRSM